MSDKIKTLSQAIRLGATFRPQGYGAGSFYNTDGVTCALGAAREALGLRGSYEGLTERFRLTETDIWIVIDLNDREKWTRERIADWLESKGL